jgi:hypothetical protein
MLSFQNILAKEISRGIKKILAVPGVTYAVLADLKGY